MNDDATQATGPPAYLRALMIVLAAYAAIGGLVTIVGWAAGMRPLTDWWGDGISMYPNAAACAIAIGFALLLLAFSERSVRIRQAARVGRYLAALFAAILGGLTFLQHVSGFDFGIDSAIFHRPWIILATAAPMRMGPPASLSFLLLGAALLMVTRGTEGRRWASALAIAALAIASLSLVGYWFGADQLFGIAQVTGIAWQTSTILAALALALLLAVPEQGLIGLLRRDDPGGAVARRLLVPIVAIPPVLMWLRLMGEVDYGLYDTSFGAAAITLAVTLLLVAVLWWTANSISREHRSAKAAEEAVRAGEARLDAVVQQLPVGVGVTDRTGAWRLSNALMEQYIPQAIPSTRPERIGRWRAYGADGNLVPPEEWPGQRALRGEIVLPGLEMIHQTDDGRELWMRVSAAPLRDDAGRIVGATVVVQDIDQIKRAELALREADRRKDEFLATLAHELRNPLGAIRTATALLLRFRADPAQLETTAAIIDRQSKQLTRLIDDLLDLGRITRGTIKLRKERLELQSALRDAVEMVQPLCERRGLHLVVDVPSHSLVLDADAVRLTQIVGNLLNNACKYTERGGRIHLEVERRADEALINVRDTGIGIAAEDLPRVFELFWHREGSSIRSRGGVGIGLALVKTLTELHGGTVEAHSEGAGKGASFSVRLPLAAKDQPILDERANERPVESAAGARVLVVDDHADGLAALSALLRAYGHAVYTADSGEAGLAAAQRLHPDVVLLDIGLPGLDGYDVARRIRAASWGASMRLVALTGWGQSEDKRRAAEAGFDAHVTKPAKYEELRHLLRRAQVPATDYVVPPARIGLDLGFTDEDDRYEAARS